MSSGAHTTADRRIGVERSERLRRLAFGDLISLVVANMLFLVTAAALARWIPSSREPSALPVVLLVVAYAASFEFDFRVGRGSAVPTQLVLVPMLFVAPTGWVPLLVAAAILLASVYDRLRGPLRVERVLMRLASGWQAVGPALVLGLAGERAPSLSDWPVYLGAVAVQAAITAVATNARQWAVVGPVPVAHLRESARAYGVNAALGVVGFALVIAEARSATALALALLVTVFASVLVRERKGRLDGELELRDAYRRAEALAGDNFDGQRREVELALAVADELGLSRRDRRDVEFAALLHDVGKASLPREILDKPGPLTPEERAVVERHTLEAELVLHGVGGLIGTIGTIVRSCQERYDGDGYPDRIAGDEIPLVARVVACCDAFNAMTSDRPYRKALSVDEALAELRSNSGTQFDPAVVDALVAVVEPR